MTELDREIQAAIDALVHRLKNRDEADDEPFAMEFVQAMIGRGWRPTEARRSTPWTAATIADATGPTDEWRRLRAERAALEAQRAREDGAA